MTNPCLTPKVVARLASSNVDFIRQAALLRVQEIEQRMSLSVLPVEAFDAFKAATEAPGKFIPGLHSAAVASEGIIKDAN